MTCVTSSSPTSRRARRATTHSNATAATSSSTREASTWGCKYTSKYHLLTYYLLTYSPSHLPTFLLRRAGRGREWLLTSAAQLTAPTRRGHVPRCRQGVARLARLLPQDRPRRRHELGVISSGPLARRARLSLRVPVTQTGAAARQRPSRGHKAYRPCHAAWPQPGRAMSPHPHDSQFNKYIKT